MEDKKQTNKHIKQTKQTPWCMIIKSVKRRGKVRTNFFSDIAYSYPYPPHARPPLMKTPPLPPYPLTKLHCIIVTEDDKTQNHQQTKKTCF